MVVHPNDAVLARENLHHLVLAGGIEVPRASDADDNAIANHNELQTVNGKTLARTMRVLLPYPPRPESP